MILRTDSVTGKNRTMQARHSALQLTGNAWVRGLALLALIFVASLRLDAAAQQQFASPDEAVNALVTAAKARDTNTLHAIFGPAAHELVSPDIVQASNESEAFLRRLTEKAALVRASDTNAVLQLGADGWPFPIPLVKQPDGKWLFDTLAGKEEILNRRIGRNELGAIRVCRAYVDAQREYASQPRSSDGVLEYAQLVRSAPGKHDGLYWPVGADEELSPLGPLIAQAHGEGYRRQTKIMTEAQSPYRGYYFKILTRQGRHAPGGKYNYIINGHMIAGFAIVAWPAEWGNSGVMTFIVNQQGKVYQKNLGAKTSAIAPRMTTYDPNASWTPVKEN
ncbi:MAG: DUF2950 domain-containing protein [Verrucomicrobiia bacterium]|jgi:hypothetical protein